MPPEELYPLLQVLYSLAPGRFFQRKYLESLMFNTKTHSLGNTSMITSIFVHASYQHLLSNLLGFVQFGLPLCSHYGTAYVNALFLTGGIVSTVSLERHILPIFVGDSCTTADFSVTTAWDVSDRGMLHGLKYTWNRLADRIGMTRTVLASGSSGGVCALIGCAFVGHCRDLLYAIKMIAAHCQERQQYVDIDRNSSGGTHRWGGVVCGHHHSAAPSPWGSSSNNCSDNSNRKWQSYRTLFHAGAGFAQLGWYIARELRHLDWTTLTAAVRGGGAGPDSSFDLSFFEKTSGGLINHSAHVQGFCCGALLAILGTLAPRIRERFTAASQGS